MTSQPDTRSTTATLVRPALTVGDLSLGFGRKTVLTGVNLEFRPGEITALIGPTGCGKSTLLRTLNRMNDKVRGLLAEGRSRARRIGHLRPFRGPASHSQARRHGLPAPESLPDVDQGQRGGGRPCSPTLTPFRNAGDRRESAQAGWTVVGHLRPDGRLALPVVRRSTATSLSGAGTGCRPPGSAFGRADLFSRSRLDRDGGEPHQEALFSSSRS